MDSNKSGHSFGMVLPGRSFSGSGYRFGFNGQEKVDEISGNGNHNTALYWEFDSRTAHRWNLDPQPTIGISDYSCFNNNPISNIDILGNKWNTWNDKLLAKSMERKANRKINQYEHQISKLQKEDVNQNSQMEIDDLIARKEEMHQAIQELHVLGDKKNPINYHFDNLVNENGQGNTEATERLAKSGETFETVVTMHAGNNAERFHEAVHAMQYNKGLINCTSNDPTMSAAYEAEAKRREYGFKNDGGPLMRNEYHNITTENWVRAVLNNSTISGKSSYFRMAKDYQHEHPDFKK